MNPTDTALLFANMSAALGRSQQMAGFLHCDGVFTKFWYNVIQLTNGQGALVVQANGAYSTKPGPTALSQLTPAEIAALQTYTTVLPLLPVALPLPSVI